MSTSVNGTTATVAFATGTFPVGTDITVTLYTASHLPRTFAGFARKSQSVPANATVLGGIAVYAGGATPAKPMALSLTASAPASGTSIVISGSASASTSFVDIDTTTYASGAASDAANTAYTGPTLAGASTLYVFYSVPTTSVATPPAITLPVSGSSSVADGQTATYTSGPETNAGTFPYLYAGATSWSLDNAALGTISSAGVFTASNSAQASGNVVATDSANSAVTAKFPIAVLSSRPATVGDSLTYAGTASEVLTANELTTPVPVPYPSTSPSAAPSPVAPAFNQSGTVAETVTVTATPAAGEFTTLSDEVDTYQLETLETKTTSNIAYQASGSTTDVRELSTSATDSNGSTFANAYTSTSGLVAVLPETNGATFTNDASDTYTESDPGVGGTSPTDTRVTNTDGSYTDTQINTDGTQNVAQASANLSGTYAFVGGYFLATFSAPTAGGIATALQSGGPGSYGTPDNFEQVLWYPSVSTPPYAETDTVQTGQTLDPSCSTTYGSSGNLTTQAIASLDPIFGTLTSETTKTYDVTGVGVVCTVFSETVNQYLDYSLQTGYILFYAETASSLFTTTYNETLSLQSASVASAPTAQSQGRRAASVTTKAVPESVTRAAVASAHARFEHRVRQEQLKRIAAFVAKARLAHGGVK